MHWGEEMVEPISSPPTDHHPANPHSTVWRATRVAPVQGIFSHVLYVCSYNTSGHAVAPPIQARMTLRLFSTHLCARLYTPIDGSAHLCSKRMCGAAFCSWAGSTT